MTTPNQPEEPWLLQPTAQLPVQAQAKRRPNVVLLALIILVVLCCGGFGLIASAIRGGGSARPEAKPALVEPSPTPSSGGGPSPSAHPTTPKPSASTRLIATVKPTTAKPTPTTARPTTTKPATPTPTATTPGIQQGVRAGEPCSPPGALGMTAKGRLLRCGPSGTDQRDRWRALVP